MKEFEIYIPLNYNDGRKIETAKLEETQRLLLEFFEGITFFPQKNKGFWKCGSVTYRDISSNN